MNTDNGSLGFAVTIDNSQLSADVQRTNAEFKKIGNTATAEGSRMQNAFSAMSGMVGMFAMGGLASIGMLGKAILDTTAKFEKFGVVLRNTLGDEKGTDALAMIANFAATTPFQLDEVTGAFIKLANQGFVPTQEQMVKLGDLASSTGKSFDQLGEALLDAQTGQFERLKEFGIKASANGDKVTFSFKEQKTTVENTNSAIQAYILSLGTMKGIVGANALISATLTGQLSNLQDKLAAMYNQIGSDNKGILYAAVGGISSLIDNYHAVGEVLEGIIAIYGVYKVATMVLAFTENAAAATKTRNLAIETEMEAQLAATRAVSASAAAAQAANAVFMAELRVTATKTVIAAENELQAKTAATASASLINPYVLAATAVAALGFAIYKVITYQTDLEKATIKLNESVLNEKDKMFQLKAELDHATEGSDQWKTSKQALLDQYGKYLTEQEKELIGTKNQSDAYIVLNKGIEDNIALKVKQESLNSISANYNPKIAEATQSITGSVKKSLGIERAAQVGQDIAPLIANIKLAIDPEARKTAEAEFETYMRKLQDEASGGSPWSTAGGNISANRGEIERALQGFKDDSDATNKAYGNVVQSAEKAKIDPIKTTYAAQMEVLKKEKTKLEKEMAVLKVTPGEDPRKKVVEKQGQIDEINKQLGVKETKEKTDQIEIVKKAMEKASGAELDGLAKKLVLLEQEKSLREAMAKASMAMAENKTMTSSGSISETGSFSTKKQQGMNAVQEALTASGIEEKAKAKLQATNEKSIEKTAKKQESIDKARQDKIDEQEKRAKEVAGYFNDVADSADYLAKSIGDSNQELSGMLTGVANIAGQLGKLAETGFKISKEQGIGMAISGATQLVGMVIGQAAENKRVMKEYYASIIAQQQQYNLLLNDQLRLNSSINGSVFLKDYLGSLNDSTNAYNDAQKKYQEEFKKFSTSEAITGKKNVVSGTNVLAGIGAGAALGAGIGSIVPVIGTAIGAAVGSVVGLLTGLFAKKKKDVVAPLLETYPDLIKANGEFNADLAKTLIANNRVTEATKATLQNLIDWKAAADAATAQMKQVITELTGSLGDDLRTALVTAFEDGTDAAKAFGTSVDKVLENIMSNMIFNAAFDGAFKQLEAGMAASYATGGDQSWLDDFQAFYAQSPELIKEFNQGMSDAKAAASGAGFDIFNSSTTSGMSGGIKAVMTEDSVSEIKGLWNRITIDIRETLTICKASAGNIVLIEQHCLRTANNTDALADIKTSLKNIDTATNKTASRI